MIHFLDLKGLTEHLKQKRNTEYESFQYTVGVLILKAFSMDAVVGRSAIQGGDLKTILTTLAVGLTVAVIGFFILRSYFTSNGAENGEYFLHRMLSLSWVIGWRIALVLFPLVGVAYFLISSAPLLAGAISVLGLLASIVYYINTMNHALREIYRATKPRDLEAFT